MKDIVKAIWLIVLRAVLVTAIVVLCVLTIWVVSGALADAFGAIEAGLATLAKAVWAWNWWNKVLAVCVMLCMTYGLEATFAAWNKFKSKRAEKKAKK